jgi:hypothetical protein
MLNPAVMIHLQKKTKNLNLSKRMKKRKKKKALKVSLKQPKNKEK